MPECNLLVKYSEFGLDVRLNHDVADKKATNARSRIRCTYNELGGYRSFIRELALFSNAAYHIFKNIAGVMRIFSGLKFLTSENISDCFEICRLIEDNFIFYNREECLYYACLVSAIIRDEKRKADASLASCHVGSSNDLEYQVGMFLRSKGYSANYHQDECRFGLNFVSINDAERIAIQCENEGCETGVGAIMKAYAACAYYNYTKAVVYSTSKFTNDAKAMAKGLGIEIVSVSPWR
jgi:hypothetical protein